MILITTSHRPTARMRTLSHDLQRMIPDSVQTSRGKLNFEEVIEKATILRADRIILIERWKGGPGKIELYSLKPISQHYFPIVYLFSARLQAELQGRTILRGGLGALAPEDSHDDVRNLSEALASFLRIQIVARGQDEKLFKALMTFNQTVSGIEVSFRRPLNGIEIGPRLTVKKTVWSDERSE